MIFFFFFLQPITVTAILQPFHVSVFPFSLSPAGTDAIPNQSRFSWTMLLQDLVGKILMWKWVRVQIPYCKDATSGPERFHTAGYGKLEIISFYACHVPMVCPKCLALVSAA